VRLILSFQSTVVVGTKFSPFTVSVKEGPPATAVPGLTDETWGWPGAGDGPLPLPSRLARVPVNWGWHPTKAKKETKRGVTKTLCIPIPDDTVRNHTMSENTFP
jgi:hypothetical protein